MITKQDVTAMQVEIERAIASIAGARGLKLQRNRAVIGDGAVKLTLELAETTPDGENAAWVRAWARHAVLSGFHEGDVGMSIAVNAKPMTILGWESSRPAYPVVCRDGRGKVVLFRASDILPIVRAQRGA